MHDANQESVDRIKLTVPWPSFNAASSVFKTGVTLSQQVCHHVGVTLCQQVCHHVGVTLHQQVCHHDESHSTSRCVTMMSHIEPAGVSPCWSHFVSAGVSPR
ncbi:hypothetical protein BsWGS_14386 [Bradybaena similaris]